MKYIAYTTKGLEKVAEQELEKILSDVSIIEVSDKRIVFETHHGPQILTTLRTIDDVGVLIVHNDQTNSLAQIISLLEATDLQTVKNSLQNFRNIVDTFSLTFSLVGIKAYSLTELMNAAQKLISKKYGWRFTQREHSNYDIRIFIDHGGAYISVRVSKESLQHRAYKTNPHLGSLRPTVAAAMVSLATKRKCGLKIIDNFCGSGTILCEALGNGNEVFGGDIDPEAVSIAESNLLNLKYVAGDKIKQLDARKTNWPNGFFDCAISNLPWNKQIEVTSITALYTETLKEYARITKPQGVICLLVSKPELLIKHAKKTLSDAHIKTMKVSLLGQSPSIVLVKKS